MSDVQLSAPTVPPAAERSGYRSISIGPYLALQSRFRNSCRRSSRYSTRIRARTVWVCSTTRPSLAERVYKHLDERAYEHLDDRCKLLWVLLAAIDGLVASCDCLLLLPLCVSALSLPAVVAACLMLPVMLPPF